MFNGEPIADRGPVIHDVEAVAFKLQCLRKLLHYVRKVVKRVFKLMHGRRRAFAKTGVIGRDQMVGVRQFWHQVSEHLRRSRETVQQKHRWVLRRTGFAVEDIQSIDVDGFVSNRHSLFLLGHSVSASNPESKMKGTQIKKMIRRSSANVVTLRR